MNFIEGPHPLLEPYSPPYSNSTVRRAFIVWMHCGQRNSFKDVCNYYHHLENLEDTLPADIRAKSRHHEFNMFSNPPPTSPYLDELFPNLYSQNNTIHQYIKKVEAIKKESSVFKLDSFNEGQKGVITNEILDTSHMIKKYCKSRMIPLCKFLTEFKEYAKKCQLNYTVNNVAFYIKRKMVEEELLMVENYSKSLSFLNFVDNVVDGPAATDISGAVTKNQGQLMFLDSINSQKQTTILKRDKKDLMNQYWNDLTSNYSNLPTRT